MKKLLIINLLIFGQLFSNKINLDIQPKTNIDIPAGKYNAVIKTGFFQKLPVELGMKDYEIAKVGDATIVLEKIESTKEQKTEVKAENM